VPFSTHHKTQYSQNKISPKGYLTLSGKLFYFPIFINGALKTAPYKIPFISGQVVIATKPEIWGFKKNLKIIFSLFKNKVSKNYFLAIKLYQNNH
jgi:hypothetical protein